MLAKNKIVFRFNEGSIDIVLLQYKLGKSIIKKVKTITNESLKNNHFSTEENINFTKVFLKKNKMINKKAIAIIALDGVITRLVEIPFMKKKDIESFIKNNIDEYFTVNMNEYYYDYKIAQMEKDKVKKFHILLIVIPKAKLNNISFFMKNSGINIERITIYPDCIGDLFNLREDENVAVIDFIRGRTNVTILEGNRIFLHSNFPMEMLDNVEESYEESYEELLDNIGYFLNFYSTRHFGNKLDKIYLLGQAFYKESFISTLNEQFNIFIEQGITDIVKNTAICDDVDMSINEYGDVLGCNLRLKEIYNKTINFNNVIESDVSKRKERNIITNMIIFFSIITIAWISVAQYYINNELPKYNTTNLDKEIKRLEKVNKEYDSLQSRKSEYEKKEKAIDIINKDEFKYTYYLQELKKGLPSNVLVSDVYVDKEKVDITVNINNSTLDKVKLVIAINNIGIFEHIELDSIKLDNSENEAKFTLKIKDPL
ncbi:type IV pilus biogenesis protein PilM [Clostridium lundense]|uniref:type IV pilus biogenesis protein PilM n=1 Tax=Clostridium lundense TaxID=319475 RepID=UPI00047F7A59|nr:hypothetical protein [Clostridium lundense]